MSTVAILPDYEASRKRYHEVLVAHLTVCYKTDWFRRNGSWCTVGALEWLVDPKPGGLAGIFFLYQLRWGGIPKVRASELFEIVHVKFRMREWKQAVDRVYSHKLDGVLFETIMQQAEDVLMVAHDPRFDGLNAAATHVYGAIIRLRNKKNTCGMLETSFHEMRVEAGVSPRTAVYVVKALVAAGLIKWYPGTRARPSMVDLVHLDALTDITLVKAHNGSGPMPYRPD